ncbi:MAG: methylated-DNA--[protein]-cysteine S-methyltransferase [Leifsonia sp.]
MTTETIHIERIDSPIGRIEITSDGEALTSLSIERDGRLPHDGAPVEPDAVLAEAVRQLDEYFDGSRTTFDLPVRLSGTPFQMAVWSELQQLDFGQFTSYGEIGAAIGRPGSGRAIGGAVGANPVPIIVGCHRVLSSDRRITGFSAGEGIPTKVWLLDHESIGHAAVSAQLTLPLPPAPADSTAAERAPSPAFAS